MDHEEALAIIETAAAEPSGLERLAAGDTADASRLAGHLAQCESCGEQLRRIGRTSELVRAAVREQPSAELRERTLAYVRAVGRPRGEAAAVAGGGVAALDRPDPARPIGISASRA